MAPSRIQYEVNKLGPIHNFVLARDGVFLPDDEPAPAVFARWYGSLVACFGLTNEDKALCQIVEAPAHHPAGLQALARGERRQISFSELSFDDDANSKYNGKAPLMAIPASRSARRTERNRPETVILTEADALRARIAQFKESKAKAIEEAKKVEETRALRAEVDALEAEEVARLKAEMDALILSGGGEEPSGDTGGVP